MLSRRRLIVFTFVFLAVRFVPMGEERVQRAIVEAFALLQEYARDHVLLCLVPALFIAGAITVLVNQTAVLRYLGPTARRRLAYPVASVAGSVLAVCSCTILPLFAGIYRRGAGLGPAATFLYAGPAINVLAIILTGRVLGLEIGLARAIGAIVLSVVIGLVMERLFPAEEPGPPLGSAPVDGPSSRTLGQDGVLVGSMIAVLVFANWGDLSGAGHRLWSTVYAAKWPLTVASLAAASIGVRRWLRTEERTEWWAATWGFAQQILPLLFGGVLIAGFLLGRPGHEGLIPAEWVSSLVGGNSLWANFFASVIGAFMYFATLTEVPILEGLIGSGMGKGPALALLLAGPALSLPSLLVIRSVLGSRRTAVYGLLVVLTATTGGMIFGALFP